MAHHLDEGVERFLHQPPLLMMTIGLTVLAAAFHEPGRATACRYAGAEPGLIGMGIYLLWPVCCNDMTDAVSVRPMGTAEGGSRGARISTSCSSSYWLAPPLPRALEISYTRRSVDLSSCS